MSQDTHTADRSVPPSFFLITIATPRSNDGVFLQARYSSRMTFARLLTVLLLAAAVTSCGDFGCVVSGDDPEVQFVRTWSPDRLAKLYADARVLASDPQARRGWSEREQNIPLSMQDLHPQFIFEREGVLTLRLKGCLDEMIDVRVGEDQIVLWWGGGPGRGEQVLWSQR